MYDELLARGPAAAAAIDALALPAVDAPLDAVTLPHDVVTAHEQTLEESLATRIDSGGYRETKPGLFVAAGATVAEFVVVRQGPVVVEAGAERGSGCGDGARAARKPPPPTPAPPEPLPLPPPPPPPPPPRLLPV